MEFFDAIANMSALSFAQHMVNGISLGSLYALIAIGYTMVYGILLMINFAHGDIVMMACYFAFFGITAFHIPWYFTFIITIIMTALLGVLIERSAYRPLREAPKNSILISAIGASFLLENLANYLFSGRPMRFPDVPLLSQNISIGGIEIQAICLVIPVVTIISLVVLLHIVNHTKTGMAMRAVSKDYEIARVMGINIDNVISITFIIGSALAAIGAIMYGIRYPGITPMMGVMPGLKCFIAAVIGGIGNIKGAVLGGFILGLGEILIVAFFPDLSGYRDAFAFIVLIVILFYKPTEGVIMTKKRDALLTIAGIIVLFGLAFFVQEEMDSYIRRIVNLCLVYAIIGLSMNLTNGFVGQFSLGQAGFMAIGAYTVGIFTVPVEFRENVFYAVPMNPLIADIELPLWAALLLGGVLAALFAFMIGTPVLRLRGDYLAVTTLGFSEIIRIWITNAQSITNGALGIKDIPPLNDVRYIFLVTLISFVFITLLVNSSYGRAFKAIREDEIAAEAMGINLFWQAPFLQVSAVVCTVRF